ncbi:MAG: hypothetical protein HC842_00495 [Cytophagales bacterium]|nr:hypothetical protein [Cytophagales bacterium]
MQYRHKGLLEERGEFSKRVLDAITHQEVNHANDEYFMSAARCAPTPELMLDHVHTGESIINGHKAKTGSYSKMDSIRLAILYNQQARAYLMNIDRDTTLARDSVYAKLAQAAINKAFTISPVRKGGFWAGLESTQAEVTIESGREAEGIKAYLALVPKLKKYRSWIYNYIAKTYERQGRIDSALKYYHWAVVESFGYEDSSRVHKQIVRCKTDYQQLPDFVAHWEDELDAVIDINSKSDVLDAAISKARLYYKHYSTTNDTSAIEHAYTAILQAYDLFTISTIITYNTANNPQLYGSDYKRLIQSDLGRIGLEGDIPKTLNQLMLKIGWEYYQQTKDADVVNAVLLRAEMTSKGRFLYLKRRQQASRFANTSISQLHARRQWTKGADSAAIANQMKNWFCY